MEGTDRPCTGSEHQGEMCLNHASDHSVKVSYWLNSTKNAQDMHIYRVL